MDMTMTEDRPAAQNPSRNTDRTTEEAAQLNEELVSESEMRVRRALDLMSGSTGQNGSQSRATEPLGLHAPSSYSSPTRRPPRRFAQDGDVPVTVIRSRRDLDAGAGQPGINRLAAAEEAADKERLARERAEQAHRDALATIRTLETRQRHIELARDEALAALKANAATVESLHAALRTHQEQLAAAQADMTASEREVRAGAAALSAERAAREVGEATLRDGLVRSRSIKIKPGTDRPARSAQKPVRRRASTTLKRKKRATKPSKPMAVRKSAVVARKPSRQQNKTAQKSRTTAARTIPRKTPALSRPHLPKTSGGTGSKKTGATPRLTGKRPPRR
jgi:hypothetical protein